MINIVGGIFGTSGYDSHTRNLANALFKVTKCRLSTQLMQGWERLVNDNELKMIQEQGSESDTTLIISTPNNWKLFSGLGINLGYCVWEGNKIPESWLDDMIDPNINFIIVPSNHTKEAILNTLKGHTNIDYDKIPPKIKIVPHGVDRTLFYSQRKKIENDGSNESQLETQSNTEEGNKTENKSVIADNHADTFRFICNKGWRGTSWDRGGVQYVLKAFAEEFSKDEKTELIIKLNPAYMHPQILKQSLDNLNLPQDRPPIKIRLENIPFNKLKNLYNEADCYICATRAEAFNLPGLEAMSCGIPTMQTNYGGQVDYMTDKNSLLIDYDLEEVKEDLMYEGILWATPKINSIRKQMRWAFENQNKIKEMGNQAEEDSRKWTWINSAEKIVEILK